MSSLMGSQSGKWKAIQIRFPHGSSCHHTLPLNSLVYSHTLYVPSNSDQVFTQAYLLFILNTREAWLAVTPGKRKAISESQVRFSHTSCSYSNSRSEQPCWQSRLATIKQFGTKVSGVLRHTDLVPLYSFLLTIPVGSHTWYIQTKNNE